jgi:hypothetical protein
MAEALLILWGIALIAIVALGVLLGWTLRRGARPEPPAIEIEESGVEGDEPLLFYYAEQSVRSNQRGDLIVRMPGTAWEPEWQNDLMRLEVCAKDPALVDVPGEWSACEVVAAYTLHAYRMTEVGTDIAVERFAAPIDVFLSLEGAAIPLRIGVRDNGRWKLAPLATLSSELLEVVQLPAGRSWVAASMASMDEVCLVQVDERNEVAEDLIAFALQG